MPRRRRSNGTVERFMPLGFLTVMMAVAVLTLPSALRPPAQQPNQTAELSPDAPPDKDQQAIISSLRQATSGVDTSEGAGDGGASTAPPSTTAPPSPPTTLVARACPRGFGSPPRQTESVYAPPCAAPFSGDNGGDTYPGVSGTEIRIAVQGWVGHTNNTTGWVGTAPNSTESSADRTFRVLQNYFNSTFQFYGRQLRFYVADPSVYNSTTQGEADQRRAAQTAVRTYGVFGASMTSVAGCDEFARLKRVAMCFNSPTESWYRQRAPYNYSWYMNSSELMRITSEMICRQLAGKPAAHAGDAIKARPRKFAVLYYDTQSGDSVGVNSYWAPPAMELRDHLRACGIEPRMIAYNNEGGSGRQALTTAVARLQADEITTVVPMLDWDSGILFTNAAEGAGYEPEYLITGAGALDRNSVAYLQNQNQWSRAFGFTAMEMMRPTRTTDCWRAYLSMESATTPEVAMCEWVWGTLWALAVGIQMAGPDLNPTTFFQGLQAYGEKRFPDHRWAMGGRWAPGRYTYSDDVAFFWWDPEAEDPTASGSGAYRFVDGGRRIRLGQMPTEPIPFFRDGVTIGPDTYKVS